jgi:hypothetical protein
MGRNMKDFLSHSAITGGVAKAISIHKAKQEEHDKGPKGFETTGRGANWEDTPAQKSATKDAVDRLDW